MLSRTKKFHKEIKLLKKMKQENLLHPLLQEQIKQNILGEITKIVPEKTYNQNRFIWQQSTKQTFMRYSTATLAGFALVGGTVLASNNTHPGDTLFSVKQVKEKVELCLCASDQGRAEMLAKHAFERIKECGNLKIHAINGDASQSIKNNLDNLTKQAQANAQIEVQNAVQALAEVKTKLGFEGNTTTVAVLDERIKDLQDKAKEAEISIDNKKSEQDESKEYQNQDQENKKKEDEHQSEEIQQNNTTPSTSDHVEIND